MIAVTFINLISVLLTFLSRYDQLRYGFEFAVLILILFFGIRYNYGNDYSAYYNMFSTINSYDVVEYSSDSASIERGWVLLNRLFAPLGFSSLVFVLTIFQFGSFYFFVKRFVDRKYRYIALFLYLFTPSLMLTMLSMMRQCVAMNILIWAVFFLVKRNLLVSFLLICLAAEFHQSAYILLLLLLLPLLYKINRRFYVVIFISVFWFFMIFRNVVGEQLSVFISTYFEKYNYYLEGGKEAVIGTGLGVIFNIIVFHLLVALDPHVEKIKESLFMKIMALGILIIPLSFIVQLVARVSSYFQLLGVTGLIPLFSLKEKRNILFIFSLGYVLMILYSYYNFFFSDVYHNYYFEYNTVF